MASKSSKWRSRTIGEIAKLSTGTTPPSSNAAYFNGDVDWFTPADIGQNIYLKNSARKITRQAVKDGKARMFDKDCVLLTCIGNIGRAGIVVEPSAANQQITGLMVNGEVIPEYLYFWLLGHKQELLSRASQSTLPIINQNKIKEITISYPSLDEQRRIINRIKECLSRVDEIRRLRQEAQKEAQAIFTSALAGFINESWPLKSLGALAIDVRNGWSGKETVGGVKAKALRLSSVHSRTIDPSESKEVRLRNTERQAFHVVKDDVFVVRGNGSKHLVGRSAMAAETYEDLIFNDLLVRVRFNSRVLPKFAHYLFHSPFLRKQIEETAKTAAGIWKVNQTHLSGLQFPCPDISQQTALIEKMDQTASICNQLTAEMAGIETELLSQSVLRKAFAGEL